MTWNKKIKPKQERYKGITDKDGLSEEERAAELNELKRDIADYRDKKADEAKQWQDLMGTSSTSDVSATMNMSDKASYGQMEEYLATAQGQYMEAAQQTALQSQILATLQSYRQMGGGGGGGYGEQIFNRLETTNSLLRDIRNEIFANLATIRNDTANLRNLR